MYADVADSSHASAASAVRGPVYCCTEVDSCRWMPFVCEVSAAGSYTLTWPLFAVPLFLLALAFVLLRKRFGGGKPQ